MVNCTFSLRARSGCPRSCLWAVKQPGCGMAPKRVCVRGLRESLLFDAASWMRYTMWGSVDVVESKGRGTLKDVVDV